MGVGATDAWGWGFCGHSGFGWGVVVGIYMRNLLAAFLLCARWGCNGPLGGPKGNSAFLSHMLHLHFPLKMSSQFLKTCLKLPVNTCGTF